VVHAAGESARLAPRLPPGTHAVVLGASSDGLLALERELTAAGVPHVAVREPDPPYRGALLALGLAPAPRASLRRHLRKHHLLAKAKKRRDPMKIDVKKARFDLAGIEERIRDLKLQRGEPHQPRWTPEDARDLLGLKRQATLTCALLAHRRGRVHLRALGGLAEQAKLLGDWPQRYAVPEEGGAMP
jgi:hypothetical protein